MIAPSSQLLVSCFRLERMFIRRDERLVFISTPLYISFTGKVGSRDGD